MENVFPEDVKNKHVKFKQYREVWLGAIIAAGHSKLTGVKHFVGLPNDEPPDVQIVKLNQERMPGGRIGTSIEALKVEITRCNLAENETLIGQIVKKNTPAYKDMTLAVYLYGGDAVYMTEITKQIEALGEIHLAEIMVVGKVDAMVDQDLPKGTFAQVFLYPVPAQTTFNIADESAFFRIPAVLTAKNRGVSTKLTPIGVLRLLPPRF